MDVSSSPRGCEGIGSLEKQGGDGAGELHHYREPPSLGTEVNGQCGQVASELIPLV